MRKLKVIKGFVDSELKKELIKQGKTEIGAKALALRKVKDVFETTDERAGILINAGYVELVQRPSLNVDEEVMKEVAIKIAEEIIEENVVGTSNEEPKGLNSELLKNEVKKTKKSTKK